MKKFICLLLSIFFVLPIIACENQAKLTKYEMDLTLNGDTLEAKTYVTYQNQTDREVANLYFSLYPNAFKQGAKLKPIYEEYVLDAYYDGLSYGGLTINEIKSGGKDLEFSLEGEDDTTLKVELLNKLKKGESVKIFMDFTVKLPKVNFRFGITENTINLTNFYPILCPEYEGQIYKCQYYPSGDPFYSECADYEVDITVPSSYVTASSLSAVKTECMGFTTKYSYKREKVRDIAFILSEKFNVLKQSVGETDVYYYYYEDTEAEKSFETIKKSLQFYSSKFSKYPYKEYVLTEADFIFGGMEYPCLTFIDASLSGENRDYCIAHETAHQWWYGLVGVNECEEAFIDEGLTEFSTLLFMSEVLNKNLNDYIEKAKNSYLDIRKHLALLHKEITPIMKKNSGEFISDADYVSIAYLRSQIAFNELYLYMGEKKFLSALKGVVNNYKYQNITYKELVNLFDKKKSGSKQLLDSFVYGESSV